MINFFKQIKLFNSLESYKRMPQSDVLFINSDVNFSNVSSQYQYSIVLNSIQEELERRGIKCTQFILPYTRLEKNKLYIPAYSADKRYFYLQFKFVICSKIARILRFILPVIKQEIDFEVSFFSEVIEQVNPKIIFAIGSPKSLSIATREKRNISLVEVMHGFGYDKIAWGWDTADTKKMPKIILTFDRVSTNTFSPLENKSIKVIELPHPWYKRFKEPINEQNKIWMSNTDFIPKFKKIILIALTWAYDGDHGPYEMYANILENGLIPQGLITAIELSQEDVFWCIKRHPVQMNENTKYAKQITFLNELVSKYSNCEWSKTSSTNNVSLFLACDGMVTMSSMIAYDASLFGIQTLMLCPTLKKGNFNENRFLDLESANYVQKEDPDHDIILDWVRKTKKLNPFSISDSKETDWEKFIISTINI